MRRFPVTLTLILWLLSTFTPTECTALTRGGNDPNGTDLDLDLNSNLDPDPDLDPVPVPTEKVNKIVKRSSDGDETDFESNDYEDGGQEDVVERVEEGDKKVFGKIYEKSEFDKFWPPRKPDGTEYEDSAAGLAEWHEFLKKKNEEHEKYEKKKEELLKELLPHRTEDELQNIINSLPRPYPYCVDGYLPFLDRNKIKYNGGDTIDWTKPDAITFEKKQCDSAETYTNCVDKDLARFIPLFEASQPLKGPVISNMFGKPNIEHLYDGANIGPYIQSITFSKIFSPDPKNGGISHPPPEGSLELPFWIHIIIKSQKDLEGLFVQAIGFPMGLPFGNFRNDFECDMGTLGGDDGSATVIDKIDTNNNIVPCKYSHGNNNGDMYPNVFAYGGHPDQKNRAQYKTFRMHFMWSSVHCNFKSRVQFLVMAVANFETLDFEAFLTPSYFLNQNNVAGSPPPYLHGTPDVGGWDGAMRCNEQNVVTANTTSPTPVVLEFDKDTSIYPIPYDYEYDRCIQDKDKTTLDHFHADNVSSALETYLTEKYGANAIQNWKLVRKLAQTCPPADVCLNEGVALDGKKLEYDENGHPKNADSHIRDLSKKLKDTEFPSCRVHFCKEPNDTVPVLFMEGDPGAAPAFIPKATETGAENVEETELKKGGTRFSAEFTTEFYRKGSQHFRRIRGTHVWCMTLAWFVLMTLGAFTARYYKETAGINANTGNSILGVGYWIWVHVILFLLSLTFMWVGILETTRFRQKPISCNLMGIYADFSLKNFCRWKKKIVRNHRKIGIAAVTLYHFALAISWARPARAFKCWKCRIPLRKIFLVIHVLFAYVGKLLCIVSISLFFVPKAQSICKSIPMLLAITEIVSIVFFAAGWVMQCIEDRKLDKSRHVFPVPEALEPADNSPCYIMKVIIVVLSAVVHLILFIGMVLIVKAIYMKTNKGSEKVAQFEEEDHGLGGKCRVISAATELGASMQGYYYAKSGPADST